MQWTSVVNLSTSDNTERGHKTPPFVIPYIKDCIKNVILNVYALFISFHNVCGKVLIICGKLALIVVTNPLTNAL